MAYNKAAFMIITIVDQNEKKNYLNETDKMTAHT